MEGYTLGEMSGTRNYAIADGDTMKRPKWASSPMGLVPLDASIWREMCGSGVRIGMGTKINAILKTRQRGLMWVRTA